LCQGEKVDRGLSRLHDTPDFPRLSLLRDFLELREIFLDQQVLDAGAA
jgi:hypothetical protein